MLTWLPTPSDDRPDPVPALLRHLENDNEVLRTGAVRAIAACAPGDERARVALLGALLDEDPDVRTDAMIALAAFAGPEDADKIRASLLGDPVREIKLAAMGVLADLGDTGAVPLLRRLVASRDEENVAWEDETGVWDEWLEVQKGAIDALGDLKADETIQDLLAARDDEYGQNLDIPVFRALAKMGAEGLVWLLSVAKTESGLARKRALAALGEMESGTLRDHLDFLLGDEAPEVRRLGLRFLDPGDDRAAYLTLNDADAGIRRAALLRFAPKRPELAAASLSADADEAVQAAALGLLPLPLDTGILEAIVQNMRAWLKVSGAALATASAKAWPDLGPDHDAEPLLNLVRDAARPLEARIAAVNALAQYSDAATTERIISLLGNEAQQVRTVALTHLAAFASAGDQVAEHALALAIEGVLLAPDKAVLNRDTDVDGLDVAMPRDDELDTPRLRITPDGEVIAASDPPSTTGGSTLEAIQLNRVQKEVEPDDTALAEDTPEETGAKRRKRRAVEGPDTIAQDLVRVALGVVALVPGDAIDAAIAVACTAADDLHRLAGYRALSERTVVTGFAGPIDQIVHAGLADRFASIRSVAAEIAAQEDGLTGELAALTDDPDPMVRAVAVRKAVSAEALPDFLADPAQIVRRAALGRILSEHDPAAVPQVFDTLLMSERIDTLTDAVHASPLIMNQTLRRLSDETLNSRQIHVLLQGLAGDSAVGTPLSS